MNLDKAQTLAEDLFKQHGLEGWRFRFDRARRRLGSCNYKEREITLSKALTHLNDEAVVRDTLLHEIAHALTPEDGHGAKWRAACLRIGAKPERCYQPGDVVVTPPRYYLVCSHCQQQIPRYRKTKASYACRSCCKRHNGGAYSRRFLLSWQEAG